jgi:c-di-GMP-binding flagellar brake protein YcgR
VLLRSGLEIERILKEMLEDRATLIASPRDDEVLFISQLLAVSPPEHIELACADYKLANSALLEAKKTHFHCSHRGLYYAFAAANAREVQKDGALVIRLDLPRELLAQQRRSEARLRLPPQAVLRCEVQLGALSFEAEVTDFSRSGINPGHAPALVDIEIRRVAKVLLTDGRPAHRARCSFHAAQQVMEDLARAFMIKLE